MKIYTFSHLVIGKKREKEEKGGKKKKEKKKEGERGKEEERSEDKSLRCKIILTYSIQNVQLSKSYNELMVQFIFECAKFDHEVHFAWNLLNVLVVIIIFYIKKFQTYQNKTF